MDALKGEPRSLVLGISGPEEGRVGSEFGGAGRGVTHRGGVGGSYMVGM
jgi:hypothetical protein